MRVTVLVTKIAMLVLVMSMAFAGRIRASDITDVQTSLQCFGVGCPLNYTNASGNPPGTTGDEDDSVGLNKMITAILTGGTNSGGNANTSYNQPVFIPPATRASGFYTLCQPLLINIPYRNSHDPLKNSESPSVKIDFSRAKFRALDMAACPTINVYSLDAASPPNCMIQVNTANRSDLVPPFTNNEPSYQVSKDTQRAWLTGIYADGSAVESDSTREARFQCIMSVSAPNVTIDHGVLRNAFQTGDITEPSANLLLLGGDNLQLHYMKIGNYNDDCTYPTYAGTSNVPNYDVENLSYTGATYTYGGVHDSYVSDLELSGAYLAGVEDTTSPGLRYQTVHAWGYNASSGGSGSGACNTIFQPKYSFELGDHNSGCDDCYADTPSVAYFHITHSAMVPTYHVLQVHGGKGIGSASVGTGTTPNPPYGFALDPNVQVDIRGFNMVGPTNIISCFTGGDGTGGTTAPAPGPPSIISGNVLPNVATSNNGCSYTYGSVATASGTTVISGNVALGNCIVTPISNLSVPSFGTNTGVACYLFTGTTAPTTFTIHLPPASGDIPFLPVGTDLSFYVQQAIATVAFSPASGFSVVNGSLSLPGNCLVHAFYALPTSTTPTWYITKAC